MCQVWNTHNTIQLWDANHTFPLPFFQSHPRHREPESQPKAGVVDFQDSILFGRRGDDSKAGILKMTAFSPDVVMMPFSLVIADNLQGLEEDGKDLLLKGKMTTGVISSDGRIVNDRFSFDTSDNLDIGITKTNNKFEIRLNSDIFRGATVVATPHFYAES